MSFEKDDFSAIVNHVISQAEMGEANPVHATMSDVDIEYIGFTVVICNIEPPKYYAYEYDTEGEYDFFNIQCPVTDGIIQNFVKKDTEDPWDVCIITITEDVDSTTVDFLYGQDSIPWMEPYLSLGHYVRPDNNTEKDELWNIDVCNAYDLENPVPTRELPLEAKGGRLTSNENKRSIDKVAGKKNWMTKLNMPIEIPLIKLKTQTDDSKTLPKPAIFQNNGAAKADTSNNLLTLQDEPDIHADSPETPSLTQENDGEPQIPLLEDTGVSETIIQLRDVYFDDYPDEDYRASSSKNAEISTDVDVENIDDNSVEVPSEENIEVDETPQVDPLPLIAHHAHIELIDKHEPYRSVALIICLTPPIVTTYGFWYNDSESSHGFWTPESKLLDEAIDLFLVQTIPDPKDYWDVCVIKIPSRGGKPEKEFIYGENAKAWLDPLSNRSKVLLGLAKPA